MSLTAVTSSKRVPKRKATRMDAEEEAYYATEDPSTPTIPTPSPRLASTASQPVLRDFPPALSLISTSSRNRARLQQASVPTMDDRSSVDELVDPTTPIIPNSPLSSSVALPDPSIREYMLGPSHELKQLRDSSSQEEVEQVLANVSSTFHKYHFREVISKPFAFAFVRRLQRLYPLDSSKRRWCEAWENWSEADFVAHVRLVFPDRRHSSAKSFLERIDAVEFKFDLDDDSVTEDFLSSLSTIRRNFPDRTQADEAAAVKTLTAHLKPIKWANWRAHFLQRQADSKMITISTVAEGSSYGARRYMTSSVVANFWRMMVSKSRAPPKPAIILLIRRRVPHPPHPPHLPHHLHRPQLHP